MTNQPNRDAFVEALRRSLLENEQLKRKNKALLSASSEPIAVIAMGCRLPGGANSPEAFWQLLMDEKRAISRFPKNRGWDQSLFAGFEGDGATEDPWWGGFIDDVDSFDADLFGISDREALAMDPQQRLLLETAWEVIERAGIVPSSLKNNDTGVFVGVPHQGYIPSIEQPAPGIDGYRLNGGLTSIISGRIAYHFGFSGPAITLDTACSSSLTAIHLAVRSLRNGETSMALAGGATIMATPEVFVEMHRQGGLARDGKCKAFADGADGTVFSEGAGLLLLERLSDARKAGHPVLAVIKGTAINQDGRSNGLTAPNGPAQENVVRLALKNAGLSHTAIDAVEAHGTGTSLGDPIEANALLNTYGKNRPQPLWLGSLKSNIGHTQTASGVIAVIKMVMAIQNGLLPKSLHTEQPSSKIAWSKGGVKLLDSQRPWPDTGNPRRAAVSSFGFSGTNNHIILEQAPAVLEQTVDDGSQPPPDQEPIFNFKGYCWPVSAATPTALRAKAGQLATLIDDCSELDLAAIGYSLAATRPNLDYRMMVTAGDRNSLLKQLRDIEKAFPPALAMGVRSTQRTAFLFSGQGCHWPSMGKQLYASCQPFSQALDQICEHMDKHLYRPLKTVIFASKDSAESALMDRTDYAQPALFAFEIAMYRTLRALGVIPDYLAGHSIGEIAAVHAADGMPLEDACLLVATRGRLMQSIQIPGAMAAIEAPEQEVLASLQGVAGVVAVAAVNGPSATVISGDHDMVCEMARQWKESGHRTQQLRVSHGFHSPHIDTISESLQATAATLNFSRLSVPIVSTLTGELLAYEQYASPDYWGNQARKAVRFYDAVNELARKGVKTFVEVGPDATLTSLGQGADMTDNTNNHASNNDKRWLATNRREKDETRVLLATLNRLYVQGQDIKWHQCLPARAPAVLPTYPFQRRQYWLKRVARDVALGGGLSKMAHPFLNAKIEIGDGSWLFTGTLTADQHHWLLDHAVGETAAAAGTLTAELMLSAGRQLGCEHLQTLVLHRLLVIPRHQPVDIQLRVSAAEHAGQYAASLMFRSPEHGDKGTWLLHGSGVLATSVNDLPSWPQLPAWPPVGAEALDFSGVYQRLYDDLGVTLGPAFQLIRRAWRHGDDLFIEAALPANGGQSDAGFLLHPTLLDAGMQAALIANEVAGEPQRMVLASINGLSIFAKGAKTLRAQLFLMSGDAGQPGHKHYGVRMFDAQCTPVAEVESFVLQPFTPGVKSAASYRSPYRMIWRELSLPTPPAIQNLCWIAPTPVPFDLVSVDQANHHQPIFNDVAMAIADGGLSHCDGAVLICPLPEDTDYAVASRRCAHRVTEALQTWLGSANCRDCPLIVLTQNAVATHDTVADPLGRQHLIQAPVWGLLRSVQQQYPGHVLLVDAEHGASLAEVMSALKTVGFSDAIKQGEYQLALRQGRFHVPRLTKEADAAVLRLPEYAEQWRLTEVQSCQEQPVALVPMEELPRPNEGQVRIDVRAFALPQTDVSGEKSRALAGVVVEVGAGVKLRCGDRVMGTVTASLTSAFVVEERVLMPLPPQWGFAQGVAWLTAEDGAHRKELAENKQPPINVNGADLRYLPHLLGGNTRNQKERVARVLTVPRALAPEGTVLITGATGTLGGLLARHLARQGEVKHLLLVSRTGPDAPGASQLLDDLDALGANAQVISCDLSERKSVKALLDSVPVEHPLTAIIHGAGIAESVGFDELTVAQTNKVMLPKVDGAWHLHELTQHLDLAAFVLFSSALEIFGMTGQAHYGAANAFLQALGRHRRQQGLCASVIAWGMWQERSGMGDQLGDDAIQQVIDFGIFAMPNDEALGYFDNALGLGRHSHLSLSIPARLNLATLMTRGNSALVLELEQPSSLKSVLPPTPQNFQGNGATAAEGQQWLLATIIAHACDVLNRTGEGFVRADSEFRSLGFDSLTSMEMGSRLSSATGVNVAAADIFEQGSPQCLSQYLLDKLAGDKNTGAIVSAATTPTSAPITAPITKPTSIPAKRNPGGFAKLLISGLAQGRALESINMLAAVASLRPSFTLAETAQQRATVTYLSEYELSENGLNENKRPVLFCLDSFLHAAGNLTYQRLSSALKGAFDVATIELVGYVNDEPLPASVDAIAELCATAIEQNIVGRPYALAGFSTGGLVAHAVGHCLSQRHQTVALPVAVVLIDSFPPGAVTNEALTDIMQQWSSSHQDLWSYHDEAITAMAWYTDLFNSHWSPGLLDMPLFLLQAEASLPPSLEKNWAQQWHGLTETICVSGSHFDLVTEQVNQTAQIIVDRLGRCIGINVLEITPP